MVHTTEIACSRRIGIGLKKPGFKCGCVISGEVMANALSRHALETADEPAVTPLFSVSPSPIRMIVVQLNERPRNRAIWMGALIRTAGANWLANGSPLA